MTDRPDTLRRLEILRRLRLFYANRPKVIALELGCSLSFIHKTMERYQCQLNPSTNQSKKSPSTSGRPTTMPSSNPTDLAGPAESEILSENM